MSITGLRQGPIHEEKDAMADGRLVRLAFVRSIRLAILVLALLVLFGRGVATAQNDARELRGAPSVPLTAVEFSLLRFSPGLRSPIVVSVNRVAL